MSPRQPQGIPLPYAYPRAGARGAPLIAEDIEAFLGHLAKIGVPPALLGPTLVQGYARFYRTLPANTPGIDKGQIPLLYALVGSGTPPLKMSKPDAAYQPGAVGSQRCGNCSSSYENVSSGDAICSQVEGGVELGAWCRLWNTDRF